MSSLFFLSKNKTYSKKLPENTKKWSFTKLATFQMFGGLYILQNILCLYNKKGHEIKSTNKQKHKNESKRSYYGKTHLI